MKKTAITILTIVMGISFVCLLALQVNYIDEILNLRRQHFESSVSRSLYEAAHQLEVAEAAYYLGNGNEDITSNAAATDSVTLNTDKYFTKNSDASTNKNRSLKETLAKRYSYERALMDELIYSILYTSSDRPLQERIDFDALDQILKNELSNNGIDLQYHFSVETNNGQIVYQCSDYDNKGSENTYTETLFKNDPVQKMGLLRVHFPEREHYIYKSGWFILPSLIFTLVLLFTFIATLIIVFRQKKVTEMKNDFINNMTHEFKTPISSISLAAQMLHDNSIKKSPQMTDRLTTTIMDETKRLRFQVEKVLQLSLYDNQKANLRMQDIDANELIAGVVHTFALKVEKNGGKIIADFQAINPLVLADEMHFTNVIFNLMDNAVKYKRDDVQLELSVKTWNEDNKLCISIKDNGIGIAKEDLKKIFEKFYRVHTGNLHDVKGFGLGLAYVKKIITAHKGTISADSELGIGTTFTIKLSNS